MNCDEKIRETAYVVQATHEESTLLWAEWHPFVEWQQDSLGFMREIGRFAKMPVTVSMLWHIINDRRVAFYEGMSQVVDYRMVEKWVDETFPCLKTRPEGRRPHCNATNFNHCLGYVWPHETRRKDVMDEYQRRWKANMVEVWR